MPCHGADPPCAARALAVSVQGSSAGGASTVSATTSDIAVKRVERPSGHATAQRPEQERGGNDDGRVDVRHSGRV